MTPDRNALLTALMGPDNAAGLSPEDALAHLADTPRGQLIAQFLQQREHDALADDEDAEPLRRLPRIDPSALPSGGEPPEHEATPAHDLGAVKKVYHAYQDLLQHHRQILQEYEELLLDVEEMEDLLERLAAALGACPECFGAEAECPACSGRGTPGSAPPDAALFATFVAPALRAIRARRHASSDSVA